MDRRLRLEILASNPLRGRIAGRYLLAGEDISDLGKTELAIRAAFKAIDNGFQACVMAPTEILANQHFKTISRMTGGLGLMRAKRMVLA